MMPFGEVTWLKGLFSEQWCAPYYVTTEIEKIGGQEVRIDGEAIGYQFARTNASHRTITTTVRNLRRTDEGLLGEITFMGRSLKVQYDSVLRRWKAIG